MKQANLKCQKNRLKKVRRKSKKYFYELRVFLLLPLIVSFFGLEGCGRHKFLNDKTNDYTVVRVEDTTNVVECAVFDKTLGTPVKDAIVMIKGETAHSLTDENGNAVIFAPSGVYRLIVTYLNTRLETRPLKISPGEKLIVKCNLFIRRVG